MTHLQVWLRLAHDEATNPTLTRDDRAEAGLVEDAVAEELRLREPQHEQEWR